MTVIHIFCRLYLYLQYKYGKKENSRMTATAAVQKTVLHSPGGTLHAQHVDNCVLQKKRKTIHNCCTSHPCVATQLAGGSNILKTKLKNGLSTDSGSLHLSSSF
ncbi:hypothetical protein ACFOLG_04210 [Vogesella facilis]|uniref:Uncharacterized protein n=1 Tax=Vogesella facilis TaxID=1655232 RepID=A0ABV7RAV3_9NEIS